MNHVYELFHRERPAGWISIDSDSGALTDWAVTDPREAPFLGSADLRKMKLWWSQRAVPASRRDMEELFRQAGCANGAGYLAKNLGLSLTDTYWLKPAGTALVWSDVNLYQHQHLRTQVVPYHNESSYDANASLGGALSKYWDISIIPPILVKKAFEHYGQQSINEVFAGTVCSLQANAEVPYTTYTADMIDGGGVESRCRAFTNELLEFVPAYEILNAEKKKNDVSLYDEYIRICAEHGLEEDRIRGAMDFQTELDFVISNTDRHLMNFGILRDPGTGTFVSPAPVFDNGNSMHYQDPLRHPFSREQLLKEKTVSFYGLTEKMLRCVRNKRAVKVDCLPGPADVQRLYVSYGLPERRAAVLAENYRTKVELFEEWQNGKKISLYHERKT